MPSYTARFEKHERLLVRIAVALGVIGFLIFALRNWRAGDANDFLVYYTTSERLLSGDWSTLYRLADGDGMLRYSPISLPVLFPLALFPFKVARLLWYFFQWGGFLGGLAVLKRAMRTTPTVTSLTFLLLYRPFLSSLIEGQIVGFMFFGLSLGLWGLLGGVARSRAWAAALGLMIPNVLKIGYALLYPLYFLVRGPGFLARMIAWTAAFSAMSLGILLLFSGGFVNFSGMLAGWWTTLFSVLDGSSEHYWLCSHYSSQAFNSALQRVYEWGFYPRDWVRPTWLGVSFVGLSGMLWVWWRQRTAARSGQNAVRTQWMLYSLGVTAYLMFMPFTYRHTLTFLAIPVMGLLAGPRTRLSSIALFAVVMFLSVPGMSVVGETVFFALQRASTPFLAMALVAAACTRQALRS